MTYSASQKWAAEALGTAFLLATVVGSGIMAENLAGGNVAIALLGNTIPTGAILVVLITMLAPISGAHFNPIVTMVFALKGEIKKREAAIYVLVQIIAGAVGVWIAHLMFGEAVFQTSSKIRSGGDQFFAEIVASFGLVAVILITLKSQASMVAMNVGLYITAAYWFTASTSFANPAVTLARTLSNSFAGIRPIDAPLFIVAQIIGALIALYLCNWLINPKEENL